jgi:hypothetical protein
MLGRFVAAVLLLVVLSALTTVVIVLGTEGGTRSFARFYARSILQDGVECPTSYGRIFWFECDAERRVVRDLPPPPASGAGI